jgi:hypothetical protein
MKLVVHKMKDCPLCDKCIKLLVVWKISYIEIYDEPEQDRLYPYITIELEYEELVDWIAREKIDWSD